MGDQATTLQAPATLGDPAAARRYRALVRGLTPGAERHQVVVSAEGRQDARRVCASASLLVYELVKLKPAEVR